MLTVRNTGTGGCNAVIYNEAASPRLTDVTATASGEVTIFGVFNIQSNPTMTNVTVTVSGESGEQSGVVNFAESKPTIKQSTLSGTDRSVWHDPQAGIVKIADTQLVGPVILGSGSFQCFNNYDENMAAVTCP
jgi:hypothetical protein